MSRLLVCCVMLGVLLLPAQGRTARPNPVQVVSGDGITLERYFLDLSQGSVGLLRLVGDTITEAIANFRGRSTPFVMAEDGFYALVVADIDTSVRSYPLQVIVATQDGGLQTLEVTVNVISAGYFGQVFTVPSDRAYLINPEVERHEFARLTALMQTITYQKLWDDAGFKPPISSEYSSAFGLYRILNQTVQTRHTGWDQTAPVGTPVGAIASGRVIYAGQLDIRGNYVLIDHGWGVFSGYAHFSQINVMVGQQVVAGEIIGLSGNTGRSSGPHLHWELNVNGEWVDGVAFMRMWLP